MVVLKGWTITVVSGVSWVTVGMLFVPAKVGGSSGVGKSWAPKPPTSGMMALARYISKLPKVDGGGKVATKDTASRPTELICTKAAPIVPKGTGTTGFITVAQGNGTWPGTHRTSPGKIRLGLVI